jgi:hypothetical protein
MRVSRVSLVRVAPACPSIVKIFSAHHLWLFREAVQLITPGGEDYIYYLVSWRGVEGVQLG